MELEPISEDPTSTEDSNAQVTTNPLNSYNLSRALRKRLEAKDVLFCHWDKGERLKKLFETIEDDLNLKRNTVLGSDIKKFLLKELMKYYLT